MEDSARTKEIIGKLSEKYFAAKHANSLLESQKKENNKIIKHAEKQLIDIMEEEGLQKFGTKFGTLSYSIKTHPSPKDFPAFVAWVHKTKSFGFLRKQINAAPVREMLKEYNELPPGVDTYEQESLLGRMDTKFRADLDKQQQKEGGTNAY